MKAWEIWSCQPEGWNLLHTFDRADLTQRRGAVGLERQRQITATINRAHGWV